VREELVNTALEQARESLINIREHKAYSQVLQRLTQEALSELEKSAGDISQTWLVLDPRDRGLLDSILPRMYLNLPINFELIFELNSWGGVIARSEDGRMVVINTLESRYERAIPVLRRQLAAFFEKEVVDEIDLA
jgi:vacuolar-type H+-ATPase subunit E/Vma4